MLRTVPKWYNTPRDWFCSYDIYSSYLTCLVLVLALTMVRVVMMVMRVQGETMVTTDHVTASHYYTEYRWSVLTQNT